MPDAPLPRLHLYVRAGCHLCEDTEAILAGLIDQRRSAGLPVPAVERRDIETNDAWHAAFLTTIPVVEIAGRRLELATSAAKLRRLLAEALDGPAAPVASEA